MSARAHWSGGAATLERWGSCCNIAGAQAAAGRPRIEGSSRSLVSMMSPWAATCSIDHGGPGKGKEPVGRQAPGGMWTVPVGGKATQPPPLQDLLPDGPAHLIQRAGPVLLRPRHLAALRRHGVPCRRCCRRRRRVGCARGRPEAAQRRLMDVLSDCYRRSAVQREAAVRTSLSARQSTASGARRKVCWAAKLRSHSPMGLLARAGAALAPASGGIVGMG